MFGDPKDCSFGKDKRSNLQRCIVTLNVIVSCDTLGMLEPFDGSCLGYTLSKLWHYVIAIENMV
jgi:hypothetical protein